MGVRNIFGTLAGVADRNMDRTCVGVTVGSFLGVSLTSAVGDQVGTFVGVLEGALVGVAARRLEGD